MAHEVLFRLPNRVLGSADLQLDVNKDGTKLGRLKVSKGSVVWVPRNRTYGYKLAWSDLALLFENNGVHETG